MTADEKNVLRLKFIDLFTKNRQIGQPVSSHLYDLADQCVAICEEKTDELEYTIEGLSETIRGEDN
jgi:hypothetical protein